VALVSFIMFPGKDYASTPVAPITSTSVAYPQGKSPTFAISQSRSINGIVRTLRRQAFPLWEFNLNLPLRDQTRNAEVLPPEFDVGGFTDLQQWQDLLQRCLGSYGQFFVDVVDDNSRLAVPLATGGIPAGPNYTLNPTTDGFSTLYIPMIYHTAGAYRGYEPCGGIASIQAVYGTSISYGVDTAVGQGILFDEVPPAGLTLTADVTFYYRCHFIDEQSWETWAGGRTTGVVKFRTVKQ
jgi:hypothetical protein